MGFLLVVLAVSVAAANAGYIRAPAAIAPGPILQTGHFAAPGAYLQAAPLAGPQFAPLAYSAPIAKAAVAVADAEYDPNPQYSYSYDIQDALTGDSKSQFETRNGDVVTGSYALNDPDGTRRMVDYTADPVNGFNAVVRKEPLHVKTIAPAPLAYAAPITKIHSAPLAYAAPGPLAYSKALFH